MAMAFIILRVASLIIIPIFFYMILSEILNFIFQINSHKCSKSIILVLTIFALLKYFYYNKIKVI